MSPQWAPPPQAAGVIRTDYERGFIKTEIVSFDLMQHGSKQKAKESGRVRMEGKDYVVADGDVVPVASVFGEACSGFTPAQRCSPHPLTA